MWYLVTLLFRMAKSAVRSDVSFFLWMTYVVVILTVFGL